MLDHIIYHDLRELNKISYLNVKYCMSITKMFVRVKMIFNVSMIILQHIRDNLSKTLFKSVLILSTGNKEMSAGIKIIFLQTFGLILSTSVTRLKVMVFPIAAPWRFPTKTSTASAGRKKRLLNSTDSGKVDFGGMLMTLPFGTTKSLASFPAINTLYTKFFGLVFVTFTCKLKV